MLETEEYIVSVTRVGYCVEHGVLYVDSRDQSWPIRHKTRGVWARHTQHEDSAEVRDIGERIGENHFARPFRQRARPHNHGRTRPATLTTSNTPSSAT